MATAGQEKTRLSEKLKQAQAAELAEVEQSTRLELERLSETLTKVVSAELSTTKSVIEEQNRAISLLLNRQNQALKDQTQTLESLKILTQGETGLIKAELLEALRSMQSEAMNDLKVSQGKTLGEVHKMQNDLINDSIAPMKASMAQLRKEGESLSKVALKAWLKPLMMSSLGALGVGLALFLAAGALAQFYSYELAKIVVLQDDIKKAKQTLADLPTGVEFVVEEGKKYILAKQIDTPLKLEEGEFKGLMVVEIK